MLSICIPVYNYSVCNLVRSLHKTARAAEIDFEILLMDDASEFEYQIANQELTNLSNVRYFTLFENIGRARIRNSLAKAAIFNLLWFLDCDVELSAQFSLQKYLKLIENQNIISGGRVYQEYLPNEKYHLHWTYGRQKESKSSHFMSNNFIMKKELWQQFPFNEHIKGYGHEDSLFEITLNRKNIKIEIIENTVIHIGLDSNEDFLKKTEESIQNLLLLYESGFIKPNEASYFRLLYNCLKIKRLNLSFLFLLLYKLFGKFIKKYLQKHSNMFLFDIYKLLVCSLNMRSTKTQNQYPA